MQLVNGLNLSMAGIPIGKNMFYRSTHMSREASADIHITAIVLDTNGNTQMHKFIHPKASGGSASSKTFRLGEGILISISVDTPTTAVRMTDLYYRGALQLGEIYDADPVYILVQGYVVPNVGLSWPFTAHRHSFADRGLVNTDNPSDPAAGSDLTFTHESDILARIHGIRFKFTADANVATRTIGISLHDGSHIFTRIFSSVTVTASQAKFFNFVPGLGLDFESVEVMTGMTSGVLMDQQWNVKTVVDNIQAGDQISDFSISIERWAID